MVVLVVPRVATFGLMEHSLPFHSPSNPKPYKIVGYDPLTNGSNPQNGRFLDSQVNPKPYMAQAARLGQDRT